jgi:Domain of unknown function (DUF4192)
MAGPEIPTVRISSPSDLVAVTPMLLGFTPRNSVIVLCLHNGRRRLGLVLRFDLTTAERRSDFASEVADRVALEGADEVFLVIFTDTAPGQVWLPHGGLVGDLESWLDDVIIDTLLVHQGRWWSYYRPDSDGVPFDETTPVATAVSAAAVLSGRGMLPDREAVVASVALELTQQQQRAMVERIERRLRRDGERALVARRIAVRTLVDRLLEVLADPRGELSDGEIADFVALVQDVVVRDEVLVRGADSEHRDSLRVLLTAVLRRTPPHFDAPVATSLAWIAYASGDGIIANVALDRALASEPNYSLAQLVADSLHRQLPPQLLEEVMRSAGEDMSGASGWDASA